MFITDNHVKAACKRFLEELKEYEEEQHNIYVVILYFIHTTQNLSQIFLQWAEYHPYDRLMLNNLMKCCMPVMGKMLYSPLICAFQTWDRIQDECGAPGYSASPLTTEIGETVEQQIFKMLNLMMRIIDQIKLKKKLITEIKSCVALESNINVIDGRHLLNKGGSGDT